MPTRPCLPLLLALLAPAVCVAVERVDSQTLAPNEAFRRMRPKVISAGPAGIPRVDRLVEPASFQPAIEPKPLPVAEVAAKADPAPLSIEVPTETLATPAITTSKKLAVKTSDDAGRRLSAAPKKSSETSGKPGELTANPLQSLMEWRPSSRTLTATGGGLAIAVGLLLATTWLIRSCAPKSSRPLPSEVVEVLGRLPLGGKQMTQLVRVGSKLVLIAVTPDGAKTLTEITDPDEVARLIAACDAKTGRGSSADFDRMLHEMADQRTAPGFLDERETGRTQANQTAYDDSAFDPRSLAAAYANTPGGRGDG